MRGAFACAVDRTGMDLAGDDVMTTAATCSTCARTHAGAGRADNLLIARTPPPNC